MGLALPVAENSGLFFWSLRKASQAMPMSTRPRKRVMDTSAAEERTVETVQIYVYDHTGWHV